MIARLRGHRMDSARTGQRNPTIASDQLTLKLGFPAS